MDLNLDLSSIMNKLKDVLPILSYAINMIAKVFSLFGFYFNEGNEEPGEEPGEDIPA